MGLLGSIGDALGSATDFVGDALGGGGGLGSAIGGAVGSIVPGIGTAGGAAAGGAIGGLFGGGNGGGGGGNGQMQDPPFLDTSPVDFGPFEVNPGAMVPGGGGNGQMQQSGGDMMAGSFQQSLMTQLVKKSVSSNKGRAILEALSSGAIQDGPIQPTVTVSTPRGEENHSPPGFRTVYVNDQPYAVFKPLASALGLLPKKSRAKITAADMKSITKADRLSKRIKSLAQKTGRLKCTNK